MVLGSSHTFIENNQQIDTGLIAFSAHIIKVYTSLIALCLSYHSTVPNTVLPSWIAELMQKD